jgi:hypothetical protein
MKTNSVSMEFGKNGATDSKSIQSNAEGVVLDSGTSFIIMPENDYKNVLTVFEETLYM